MKEIQVADCFNLSYLIIIIFIVKINNSLLGIDIVIIIITTIVNKWNSKYIGFGLNISLDCFTVAGFSST